MDAHPLTLMDKHICESFGGSAKCKKISGKWVYKKCKFLLFNYSYNTVIT